MPGLRKLASIQGKDADLNRVQSAWMAILNPALDALDALRWPRFILSCPINTDFPTDTGKILFRFTPRFAGRIVAVEFFLDEATQIEGTGSFGLFIAGVQTTGGEFILAPVAVVVAGTTFDANAITGGNAFRAGDEITIRCTSFAFVEDFFTNGTVLLHFG